MKTFYVFPRLRFLLRVVPLFVLSLFVSCNTGYVFKQGPEFLRLMRQRTSIGRALEQREFTGEQQEKLALVPKVRSYARDQTGLSVNDAFTTFVMLDRSAVSWNITATSKTSLQPITWSFPFAGSFPYIGFFDRSGAVAFRDRLTAAGYDVYMRPVSAFSTLGWFSDPVYSPMLEHPKPILIEIVFHELVHKNIFFKDHLSLNESIATEIGRIATIDFLKAKYGNNSSIVKWTRRYHEDQVRFRRFFMDLRERLHNVYRTEKSDNWKRRKKHQILTRARRSYVLLLDQMNTNGWEHHLSIPWDNAFIASRAVYFKYTQQIRTLWKDVFKKDLRKTVQYLMSLDGTEPIHHINERISATGRNRNQVEEQEESRTSSR